jgi:carboxyl-terminal processing protease
MNNGHENESKKMSGRIPVAGVAILIVIVAGLAFDVTKAENDNFVADIIRLERVTTKIHQNYVEAIDSKKLVDNAIDGMLQILDPHSTYFEKKQYEELLIQTEGKFGGLGIQISIRDKVLTVMTPIPGTPAERAGIQSGDMILKISGKSTEGITIDQAVGKLRGEPGTDVTITIRRRGEPKDLDYKITREIIHIKSVPYFGVVGDGIGYVALKQFSEEAGSETEKAIKELLKKNVKGIVFDLRYNPGGLLPQAIEVAEKFLPKKSMVVYTRGRLQGQNRDYLASGNPVVPPEIPIVVLVNNGSASASEIVAGAIQDWDRGVIVGDTTFGKGSVQSILQIDEVNHLKLTTAFYYTPSGRCINKPENGIRGLKKADDDTDEDADGEGKKDTAAKDTSAKGGAAKTNIKGDGAQKDTTTYKTNKGRTVHGGGGIIPDTVFEQKYPELVVRALFLKDAFFSFANIEYPKLKAKKVKFDNTFTVTDAISKDFYHFLDSIKFNYQSYAQIVFDDFKSRAGIVDSAVAHAKDSSGKALADSLGKLRNRPEWTKEERELLKKITGQMASILAEENKREFTKNETDIRSYVREALLVRELGQDNDQVYRRKLMDDVQFKCALAIIGNKSVYENLLKVKTPIKGK